MIGFVVVVSSLFACAFLEALVLVGTFFSSLPSTALTDFLDALFLSGVASEACVSS